MPKPRRVSHSEGLRWFLRLFQSAGVKSTANFLSRSSRKFPASAGFPQKWAKTGKFGEKVVGEKTRVLLARRRRWRFHHNGVIVDLASEAVVYRGQATRLNARARKRANERYIIIPKGYSWQSGSSRKRRLGLRKVARPLFAHSLGGRHQWLQFANPRGRTFRIRTNAHSSRTFYLALVSSF